MRASAAPTRPSSRRATTVTPAIVPTPDRPRRPGAARRAGRAGSAKAVPSPGAGGWSTLVDAAPEGAIGVPRSAAGSESLGAETESGLPAVAAPGDWSTGPDCDGAAAGGGGAEGPVPAGGAGGGEAVVFPVDAGDAVPVGHGAGTVVGTRAGSAGAGGRSPDRRRGAVVDVVEVVEVVVGQAAWAPAHPAPRAPKGRTRRNAPPNQTDLRTKDMVRECPTSAPGQPAPLHIGQCCFVHPGREGTDRRLRRA